MNYNIAIKAIVILVFFILASCQKDSDYYFIFSGMNCTIPPKQTGVQQPRGEVNSLIFQFDVQRVFITNVENQGNTALLFDPQKLYGIPADAYVEWIFKNRIRINGVDRYDSATLNQETIDVSKYYNVDKKYGEIDNRRHLIIRDKEGLFRGYEWCDVNSSREKVYCQIQANIKSTPFIVKFGYTLEKSSASLAYAKKIVDQFSENCVPGGGE